MERGCVVLDQPQRVGRRSRGRILSAANHCVAGAAEGSVPGIRVAMLVLEARTRGTQVTLSDEHDDFLRMPLDQVGSLELRPGFDQFFADYAARGKRRLPKKAGVK